MPFSSNRFFLPCAGSETANGKLHGICADSLEINGHALHIDHTRGRCVAVLLELELELELIQSHMAQKPVLRGEVGCCPTA